MYRAARAYGSEHCDVIQSGKNGRTTAVRLLIRLLTTYKDTVNDRGCVS